MYAKVDTKVGCVWVVPRDPHVEGWVEVDNKNITIVSKDEEWWGWYCGMNKEGLPKVVVLLHGDQESVRMRVTYRYKHSIPYWTLVRARFLPEKQESKRCPVCLGTKQSEYIVDGVPIRQVCLECYGVGRVEHDPSAGILGLPEREPDRAILEGLKEYDEWLAAQDEGPLGPPIYRKGVEELRDWGAVVPRLSKKKRRVNRRKKWRRY